MEKLSMKKETVLILVEPMKGLTATTNVRNVTSLLYRTLEQNVRSQFVSSINSSINKVNVDPAQIGQVKLKIEELV